MSQRRGGGSKDTGGVHAEEVVPFSRSLDGPASGSMGGMDRDADDTVDTASPSEEPTNAVSIDARYNAESQQIRNKQWRESYFARGCTNSTWEAEYAKLRENGVKGEIARMTGGNERESVPCGCCSAIACSFLGAGRVGNMAVLKQSNEWVTEEVPDEENGGFKTERSTRPKLDFVVGPVSETTRYFVALILVRRNSVMVHEWYA